MSHLAAPSTSLRSRLLTMAADPIVGPLCSALLAEAAAAVPSAMGPSHDDLIRNARSWATASPMEQSSGSFLAAQLFAKEVLRLNGSSDGSAA